MKKIKSRGLLPDEYNKTGDLDILYKIKLHDLLPDEYMKTGDLDTVDKINGLLDERHKIRQHMSISWSLN